VASPSGKLDLGRCAVCLVPFTSTAQYKALYPNQKGSPKICRYHDRDAEQRLEAGTKLQPVTDPWEREAVRLGYRQGSFG